MHSLHVGGPNEVQENRFTADLAGFKSQILAQYRTLVAYDTHSSEKLLKKALIIHYICTCSSQFLCPV